MVDLTNLSPRDFETVVGGLLSREGFGIEAQAKPGQRGPDFEAVSPSGVTYFVEVKHYRQPIPEALIASLAGDVERFRYQSPKARGLIVLSGTLSRAALERIKSYPELDYWTGEDVIRKLENHPDLLAAVQASQGALQALALSAMVTAPAPAAAPESARYSVRLDTIETGKPGWKDYERWCTEILTAIFKPDLGPPDTQTRTDDGLDIMDAIFPIRSNMPPWSLIRAEFQTRFVVAEFKNFSDPIGQKQVESIAQYLWTDAKRVFGILVARHPPAAAAIAQRRRFWLMEKKMIVMVTDAELIAMLQQREAGVEPFDIIDTQLEEFFRTLTP